VHLRWNLTNKSSNTLKMIITIPHLFIALYSTYYNNRNDYFFFLSPWRSIQRTLYSPNWLWYVLRPLLYRWCHQLITLVLSLSVFLVPFLYDNQLVSFLCIIVNHSYANFIFFLSDLLIIVSMINFKYYMLGM